MHRPTAGCQTGVDTATACLPLHNTSCTYLLSPQVQLLDNQITALSGQPSQQRKTRTMREAAKKKMQPDLEDLQGWLHGGYEYEAFSLLPEPIRRLAIGAWPLAPPPGASESMTLAG